jgi:hypothetical protein
MWSCVTSGQEGLLEGFSLCGIGGWWKKIEECMRDFTIFFL